MGPMQILEQAPLLAPLVGVLVGVVLAASPLAWPMAAMTVAAGVATSEDEQPPWTTIAAVGAGITAVYVALGIGVGVIDVLVRDVLGATAGIAYALLAATSLAAGGTLIARPLAACRVRSAEPRRASGAAVVLGMTLSAVTCPACAGVVTGVAISAAAAWGPVSATLAMLGLGVGHTLALAGMFRLLRPLTVGTRRAHIAQRIAGFAMVALAVFFAWQAAHIGLTVAPSLP